MTLKEQILDIRDSGEANMLDANAVQVAANERGYYELVCFIEDNRRDYGKYILTGDESLLGGD